MNDYFANLYEKIKHKILGRNNENIDFIIDSFYKLKPEQRMAIIGGGFFAILLGVFFVSYLYFNKIKEFDNKLNQGWLAYSDFKRRAVEYKSAEEGLENIIKKVKSKVGTLKLKPFFEKASKEQDIEYKSLNVQEIEKDDTEIIYKKIKEYEIDVSVTRISIPRLIKFLLYVEKANKLFKIKDLKISGLYDDKLYFDTSVVFRAFLTD